MIAISNDIKRKQTKQQSQTHYLSGKLTRQRMQVATEPDKEDGRDAEKLDPIPVHRSPAAASSHALPENTSPSQLRTEP